MQTRFVRSVRQLFAQVLMLALAAMYFNPATGAFAAEPAPSGDFTIKSIKADPSGDSVVIEFTEPFELQQAINHLAVTPPTVKFRSSESSMVGSTALQVKGEFRIGASYGVKFSQGFAALSGKAYVETLKEFSVPHQSPKMDFALNGSVIELKSRQLLHLNVVNVDSLVVEAEKVSPLVYFVRMNDLAATAEEERALLQAIPPKHPLRAYAGEPSVSRDLYDTRSKRDQEQSFSMPLVNRKAKEKGALLFVTLKDTAAGGAGSTKPAFFNVTDLAITCLAGGKDTLVWVTSISTGLPVAGVRILAATTDGVLFSAGKTDNDGIARIKPGKKKGFRLQKTAGIELTAADGVEYLPGKLKYLCALSTTDVAVSGAPDAAAWGLTFSGVRQTSNLSDQPKEMQTALFTERGVYRPGETVHLKGVARAFREGGVHAATGESCKVTLVDSKGQTIHDEPVSLGEFGSAALDIEIAGSAPLGEYRADLQCGASQTAATFRVEEFKPPRHFSRLGFEKIRRKDDSYVDRQVKMDFLKVKVSGGYYAGGPVKNARVRWQLAYGPSSRSLDGYDNYTFGHETPDQEPEPLESGESYLDGDGQLTLEFPMSREVLAGEKSLVVTATVLDFDGRAASVTKSWTAQSPYNVGIAAHQENIAADSEQILNAIVVDAAGKRVPEGKIEAEVLRQSWIYYRKRNLEGNEYWVDEKVWRRVSINELALQSGAVSFGAGFDWGGDYLVKVTYFAPDGKSYSSATRYQVGWVSADEDSRNRDRNAQRAPLYADRASYRPGQTAVVRLGVRRKGAAYLTVIGRDGIASYEVTRPANGLKKIKTPLTDKNAPNVYAIVVGTLGRGAFPVYTGRIDDGLPTLFYGAIDLPVTKKPDTLAIAIAPESKKELAAEPGQEVTIKLAATGEGGKGARAELAVAVVDEAVLALTGYVTPDIKGLARFNLPLALFLTDLRAFLLPQTPFKIVKNEALTGGSDGMGLPVDTRKKFEPVAYWNPALVTGADGKATITFRLPDQMSSFRVFVVACDTDSAFGNAERQLRAAKPFYLEPGIPRFFTRGDSFRMEVAAFNQTPAAGEMRFAVEERGGLAVAAERETLAVGATDWAPVGVTGKAEETGDSTLLFQGSLGKRSDAVELTVPVHSGNVRGQSTYYGVIRGKAAITPPLPPIAREVAADPGLLSEARATLLLSASPFLRMTAGLRYLLHYPYGCIEQTSSGVMPLAALRAIIRNDAIPGITVAETDQFLAKGVERLLSMQTDSGGFAYWPGDEEVSTWGTFYAAAALAEAKRAGFEVPDEALERLAGYLTNDAVNQPFENGGGAVALYLLARLEYELPEFSKKLAEMGREEGIFFLLAATLDGKLKGDELQRQVQLVLVKPVTEGTHTHDFSARHRTEALALMLLDAVSPSAREGEQLAAKLLAGQSPEGHWNSTSDSGWVLVALGQHFKAPAARGTQKVEVILPGGRKQVMEIPAAGFATLDLPTKDFLANPVISATGDPKHEILYGLTVTLPRIDYAKEGHDGGFVLSKRIENADGSPEINVGDLVRVTLEFSPPDGESEYIVLDDPLPAGLVAINSAFRTEEVVGEDNDAEDLEPDSEGYWERFWSPDGYYRLLPDHLEIRDDRVVAFRSDLWGWSRSPYRFVYYARAVCEGEFVAPSTRIERMYEPEVHGVTPQTRLKIGGRKQ